MYSQTLLTTSGRGSGLEPTTAASSFDGCKGLIRAGLTFLPDELLPALASLPDVPSAGLALLPEVLFTAGALAFLAGPSFAASTFLSCVLCFVLPGIAVLPFSALPRRRVSLPLGRVQDVEGQQTGDIKTNIDHHRVASSASVGRVRGGGLGSVRSSRCYPPQTGTSSPGPCLKRGSGRKAMTEKEGRLIQTGCPSVKRAVA